MPDYKDGLGRDGTKCLKIRKFRKNNKWQLEAFPNDKTKIIAILTFREWCEVTEYCISNKISKVALIKELLLNTIKTNDKETVTRVKRKGRDKNKLQGKLF